MLVVRRSQDRGYFDHGWLKTYHTFSFADYHDPKFMGFRSLRVINEDRVSPGRGFPTHAHADMEILSYVLEGGLAHEDSMGNGSVVRPGELQRMSAGTGVRHSEANASATEVVHFLQIWILPERRGLAPSYEQREFGLAAAPGRWVLMASPAGKDGALRIHQDVRLSGAVIEPAQSLAYELAAGRHAWIQVARGEVSVDDVHLNAGDGLAASELTAIEIEAHQPSEILLFDLS
jgi:redox-sensitive bicupin YhaK (pirin superfamily)